MAESTALKELQDEIKIKTEALQTAIKPAEGVEPKDAETIKSMTAELKALHGKRKGLAETAKAQEFLTWMGEVDPDDKPALSTQDPRKSEDAFKSVGELFTERPEFKNYQFGTGMADLALNRSLSDIRGGKFDSKMVAQEAMKALFQTSAGFAPESIRLPTVVGAIHRPIQLLDRVRQVPIAMEQAKWMEQTTRTVPPGSGSTAEGAAYREIAIEFTERTADIVKLTGNLPATEEQLADVPFVQDIVTSQIPAMLGEHIDDGIVNGTAATNRLIGVTSLARRLTRTKAADENLYTAIALAMGDVQVSGRATPSMILIHTLDYLEMMLEQTREGNYLFGMLGQMGQSPWGPQVVQCDFLARGTYIVGDFAMYHVLRDRQDFRVRVSPRFATPSAAGHTNPTGMVNIYGDVRAQNTFLRQQAFCHVTS